MQNDLSKFRNTIRSIRQVVVTASIVTAIGLAGVVGARTIERGPSGKTIIPVERIAKLTTISRTSEPSRRPLKAKPVELLRDIPTDAITHSGTHIVMMEVTAYCACPKCCGPNATGLTASGKDISYNFGKFVAADAKLPFGTKLLIPGYSSDPVEVIDRGGAIRGDRLDVFFPTHEAALEWGRRTVQVTILDD